jgi:hypothetical protein
MPSGEILTSVARTRKGHHLKKPMKEGWRDRRGSSVPDENRSTLTIDSSIAADLRRLDAKNSEQPRSSNRQISEPLKLR